MKNALRKLAHAARNRYTQAGAATTGLLVAGTASAQEATGASAAFGEIQSQVNELASDAWPVVIAVVGSLIAISLFKKFANRAS